MMKSTPNLLVFSSATFMQATSVGFKVGTAMDRYHVLSHNIVRLHLVLNNLMHFQFYVICKQKNSSLTSAGSAQLVFPFVNAYPGGK